MKGKDGKLRVRTTREGSQVVSKEQVLSDEEMAWRLHQELNATSPMLRTRSRKAPDAFPGQKLSGGSHEERKVEASGSHEVDRGSNGEGGPAPSVNKTDEAAAVHPPAQQADSHTKVSLHVVHAPQGKAEPACSRSVAQPEPGAFRKRDQLRDSSNHRQGSSAGMAEKTPSGSHTGNGPAGRDAGTASRARASSGAKPAAGDKPATVAHSNPGSSAHGTASSDDALNNSAGMASQPADGGRTTRSRHAAAGSAMANGKGQDHHVQQPQQSQQERQQPLKKKGEEGVEKPSKPPQQQQGQEQKEAGAGQKELKPSKPLKMPKLPMVRQENGRWYRARLLRDTGERVSLEFTGFEHQFPVIWLPRDSDRIWRGSYKGKDWKHLGGGSWEPKSKGGRRRAKSTAKRKRPEMRDSEEMAHSSGDSGHSLDNSAENFDVEDFDEAESGPRKKEALKQEAEHQEAAGAGASVGAHLAAAEVKSEDGCSDGAAVEAQHPQQGPKDEEMVDAPEPVRKKSKRSSSRKRLDPIVREALMAAGQAEDSDEAEAGPSRTAEAATTPISWKGSGKRGHRFATHVGEEDTAMPDPPPRGHPHYTPTPETPVTRLGKRSSLTPGNAHPLSPRAAAAAAAAIKDAAGASPVEEGEGLGVPVDPHFETLGMSPREAASSQLHPLDTPFDAPVSPRHDRKRGTAAAADMPGSPRPRPLPTAKAAGGSEDAGGGAERKGSRRGRRTPKDLPAAADGQESEGEEEVEEGEQGSGSDVLGKVAARRPRRQHRKAAILKDDDFAFGEDVEEEAMEAMGVGIEEGVPPGATAEPPQPARRRRKPLVSSPAPTDVGLSSSSGGRGPALPAVLAALDVLPPEEQPAPAAAEDSTGMAVPAELAGHVQDADEAAAVAALADLPTPRSALAAQRAQQLWRRAEAEAEGAGQRERGDADADAAVHTRRREIPFGPAVLELPVRKRSGAVAARQDSVRSGRVHKQYATSPLSHHHSLAFAPDRPPHHARHMSGGSSRHTRSSGGGGSSADDDRWGGRPPCEPPGGRRRGCMGGVRRGGSPPAGSPLDGISAAQAMFGTILSALKRCSLDDSNGPKAAERGAAGQLRASLAVQDEPGSMGGGKGASRTHLHLFSSAWSCSRWHANGEKHPSILRLQPDLFDQLGDLEGGPALLGIGQAAASRQLQPCPSSKPPIPLFC